VPETADAVRMVNVFPNAGEKGLIRLTFSAPASVAVPVKVTESNCPAPVPPIFTLKAPAELWV